MTLPKLLQQITIDANSTTFGFEYPISTSQTVDIDVGTYDTILEVLGNLEDKLQAVNANFSVEINLLANIYGNITITRTGGDWAEDWTSTDASLRVLLGFTGAETVSTSYMTATRRHRSGFYSPCGVQWPADARDIRCREQETEGGGLAQLASTTVHRYRELTVGLLSEAQLELGGTDDDGIGGSVYWSDRTLYDFWEDTASKSFRFYPDAQDGTVASPGSENTDFVTCRRFADRWQPQQRDPGDWSFFDVTMRLKVTGE